MGRCSFSNMFTQKFLEPIIFVHCWSVYFESLMLTLDKKTKEETHVQEHPLNKLYSIPVDEAPYIKSCQNLYHSVVIFMNTVFLLL